MLTISPNTFDAFSSVEEQKFNARLAEFLREEVPGFAQLPQETLLKQVSAVVSSAREFGMESEEAVACYALTAAHLGPDFPDKFPGARQILDAPISDDEKAEHLEAYSVSLFEALAV